MRKTFYIIGLVIFTNLFCPKLYANQNKETTIILINPTYGNLDRITTLVNNNYISIPDLKVIGVYNVNSTYDFKKCLTYAQKHPYIKLEGYNFNIGIDSLFVPNSCTQKFYELFKKSDGILFLGGDDIPPQVYKSKTNLLTYIFESDHLYELSFLFHLIGGKQNPDFKPFLEEKPDYSILGICLGMQSINVAAGGTLYQDIPTEIYKMRYNEDVVSQPPDNIHRCYWKGIVYDDTIPNYCFHKISILPGTLLSKMIEPGFQSTVLSYHHQCINLPGMNIKTTATSIDGKIIEGIEHTKYKNVYGVQFHPEYRVLYDYTEMLKPSPADKLKSTNEILDEKSKMFYKSFWAFYSELFSSK